MGRPQQVGSVPGNPFVRVIMRVFLLRHLHSEANESKGYVKRGIRVLGSEEGIVLRSILQLVVFEISDIFSTILAFYGS